jgi:hypothetical protein
MSDQPRVPAPETARQLLVNLRRTRLEMQEFNLELAEINAKLERDIREQKLQRLRRATGDSSTAESLFSESNL